MTNEQIARSMAFKNCFGTEHGQKVLEVLDGKCFYKSDPYHADSERQTSYNLGKHAVILYIHQEIDRNLTEPDDNKAKHKEII